MISRALSGSNTTPTHGRPAPFVREKEMPSTLSYNTNSPLTAPLFNTFFVLIFVITIQDVYLEKRQLLIWSLIKFYNSAFYAYSHLIFLSSHIPRPEEEEEGGFCSCFGRLHFLMIILLLLGSFLVVLSQQFSVRGTIKLMCTKCIIVSQARPDSPHMRDWPTRLQKYIFKSRFKMDEYH